MSQRLEAFMSKFIEDQLLHHKEELKERLKSNDELIDLMASWLVNQAIEEAHRRAMERWKEMGIAQEYKGEAEGQP